MIVTEEMRLRRALGHLEQLRRMEYSALCRMEGINLTEVIIARNKQQIHLAEIDQIIRNIKDKLEGIAS